jgi:hypothetical protein
MRFLLNERPAIMQGNLVHIWPEPGLEPGSGKEPDPKFINGPDPELNYISSKKINLAN